MMALCGLQGNQSSSKMAGITNPRRRGFTVTTFLLQKTYRILLLSLAVLSNAVQTSSNNATGAFTLAQSPSNTPVAISHASATPVSVALPGMSSDGALANLLSHSTSRGAPSNMPSTMYGPETQVFLTSSTVALEAMMTEVELALSPTHSQDNPVVTLFSLDTTMIMPSSSIFEDLATHFPSSFPSSLSPSSSLSASSSPPLFVMSSVFVTAPMQSPTQSLQSMPSTATPDLLTSLEISSPASISFQTSVYEINLTMSSPYIAPTQSLRPTHIYPTPTPTMDSSSPEPFTPSEGLNVYQWFGIAVAAAAVIFILFLAYHCHQQRQRTLRKQKKEMRREILHVDLSESGRQDRVSSWRNSLALDAMTTHIELPQEDSMDMQARDNDGFVDVFLGEERDKPANNNYFMPLTNL